MAFMDHHYQIWGPHLYRLVKGSIAAELPGGTVAAILRLSRLSTLCVFMKSSDFLVTAPVGLVSVHSTLRRNALSSPGLKTSCTLTSIPVPLRNLLPQSISRSR